MRSRSNAVWNPRYRLPAAPVAQRPLPRSCTRCAPISPAAGCDRCQIQTRPRRHIRQAEGPRRLHHEVDTRGGRPALEEFFLLQKARSPTQSARQRRCGLRPKWIASVADGAPTPTQLRVPDGTTARWHAHLRYGRHRQPRISPRLSSGSMDSDKPIPGRARQQLAAMAGHAGFNGSGSARLRLGRHVEQHRHPNATRINRVKRDFGGQPVAQNHQNARLQPASARRVWLPCDDAGAAGSGDQPAAALGRVPEPERFVCRGAEHSRMHTDTGLPTGVVVGRA